MVNRIIKIYENKIIQNRLIFIKERIMKTLKIITVSISLILLSLSTVFAQNVNVGDLAPSFQLTKFGGGTVSMSDYPDKIIMLNFLGSY